jgi:hypothetical protein
MMDEVHKYPVIQHLSNVSDAIDILQEENPAKVPRFEKYLHDMNRAIKNNDPERLKRLMDEALPQVDEVLDSEKNRKLHIWKEIRQ